MSSAFQWHVTQNINIYFVILSNYKSQIIICTIQLLFISHNLLWGFFPYSATPTGPRFIGVVPFEYNGAQFGIR